MSNITASATFTGASDDIGWWEGQSLTLGSAETPNDCGIYAIGYESVRI